MWLAIVTRSWDDSLWPGWCSHCCSLGKMSSKTILLLWVNTWTEIATARGSCYCYRVVFCRTYLPWSGRVIHSLPQARCKIQFTSSSLAEAVGDDLPACRSCAQAGRRAMFPGKRTMGGGQQTAQHQGRPWRGWSDLLRGSVETITWTPSRHRQNPCSSAWELETSMTLKALSWWFLASGGWLMPTCRSEYIQCHNFRWRTRRALCNKTAKDGGRRKQREQ